MLFLCDTRVERIVVSNGRAVGVSGRVLDRATGRPRFRAEIRAKTVVAAAGALHTPALLRASGIARGNPALGRHLKLHLCARATGVFDEPVDAFRGACQGVYVDDYLGEGVMLEGTFSGPCSQLPGLFGFGPGFAAKAASYRHMACIGILTSETAEGRVVTGIRGKPLVLYQASQRDAQTMHWAMLRADRILFAAGARQVINGSYAFPEANAPSDLDRAGALRVRPQDLLMMAFHPQGTCRMGVDRRRSVVRESGECHDVACLYIADASVFASSIGVNPQETVWAVAHTVARHIARDAFDL